MGAPQQSMQRTSLNLSLVQVHADADNDAEIRIAEIRTEEWRKDPEPVQRAARNIGSHAERQEDREYQQGHQISKHLKYRQAEPLYKFG